MQERKYGEEGREGKIERRGLHKQESGTFEMAESERLNLSADGLMFAGCCWCQALEGLRGCVSPRLGRACVYVLSVDLRSV